MFFKQLLKGIGRLASGETIRQIDTPVPSVGSNYKISLFLKTKDKIPYVVLALLAPGNRQYCVMEVDEFQSLFTAMAEIRSDATRLSQASRVEGE
ncbi:hypothetical protein [Xanthobacter sp.]|uniref:hypothetical protein n=1 Tax=Xanthobacter sp. TaxID=35809 RepID=UPI0035B0600C